MDTFKILLIFGLMAMVIAVISVGVFVWHNPGSRNLALATGTIGAALILFAIQLPFELRGSESTDFITAEFTIDRVKPQIRQWTYALDTGWRILSEIQASNWLADNNPDLFADDRKKVTSDLAVFSLISYLTTAQYDWQLKKQSFSGPSMGTITTYQRVSKSHECTELQEQDLRDRLSQADNAFAKAKLWLVAGPLCLPPNTNLTVTPTSLTLRNLFCVISFNFELVSAVSYVEPGTRGEVPVLENGDQQFETRLMGIRVKVNHFGLRIQHRDSPLYRDWTSRLVKGAQDWFAGPQQ